jgi:hypothetical protein
LLYKLPYNPNFLFVALILFMTWHIHFENLQFFILEIFSYLLTYVHETCYIEVMLFQLNFTMN